MHQSEFCPFDIFWDISFSLLINFITSLTCSDAVFDITKVSLSVHLHVQFYSRTFWNHVHSLAHVFVCRLSGYLCFGSVIFDRVLEMSQKLTWSIVFAGIAQKHAPSFVWNISSKGILNIKFRASMKITKYMFTAKPLTQVYIHHATYLLPLRLNQSFQSILNTFWASNTLKYIEFG